jgi:hypothetical protein
LLLHPRRILRILLLALALAQRLARGGGLLDPLCGAVHPFVLLVSFAARARQVACVCAAIMLGIDGSVDGVSE